MKEPISINEGQVFKKHVSQILKEKRKWISVNDEKPEEGKKVVIRLYSKEKVFGEDAQHIYVAEDVKIGLYENGNWIIAGPHPLFDYSPLSSKEQLTGDTIVTHWAEPEKEPVDELKGWETRFDKVTDIQLKLNIKPHEDIELVYKALLWGSFGLTQVANNGYINESPETIQLYHGILCDLQHSLDFNSGEEE